MVSQTDGLLGRLLPLIENPSRPLVRRRLGGVPGETTVLSRVSTFLMTGIPAKSFKSVPGWVIHCCTSVDDQEA